MKHKAGFTLLEMLIGLALLGFIMALLFGGFRLATRSWDTVTAHAHETAYESAGVSLLRRLLSSIQPLHMNRLPRQPLAFLGLPERISLVAPLTEQVGLRLIELGLERELDTYKLVLRDGPPPYAASAIGEPLADTENRVLIEDLRGAEFRYYGSAHPGEPASWHDQWQHPEQLPALIRILLSRKDGSPLDLVVATTIDASRTSRVRITIGGSS